MQYIKLSLKKKNLRKTKRWCITTPFIFPGLAASFVKVPAKGTWGNGTCLPDESRMTRWPLGGLQKEAACPGEQSQICVCVWERGGAAFLLLKRSEKSDLKRAVGLLPSAGSATDELLRKGVHHQTDDLASCLCIRSFPARFPCLAISQLCLLLDFTQIPRVFKICQIPDQQQKLPP